MVGHLLVFTELYAEQAGYLWWKTLSDPRPAFEVLSFIDGEWEDFFLMDADEVDAAVANFERGRWQSFADTVSTTLLLRWLDDDESSRVAADVFDVDLNAERRQRLRSA